MHIPDLSEPRMLSIDEVALLFNLRPRTVTTYLRNNTFPVPPRIYGKGVVTQWSSVDLRRYFDDPKAFSKPKAKK